MPSLPELSLILAIEASTAAGSVALLRDGTLVASADVPMGAGCSDGLFPAVQALLRDAGLSPRDLGAVVCGAGPGSFTSLRIAGALAKGLAHGANVPLFAVSSLLLGAAALSVDAPPGDYVVHSDALRGERYALPVRRRADGLVEAAGPVSRVAVAVLAATTDEKQRLSVGAALQSLPGLSVVTPGARQILAVAGDWRETAVDLATWEPAYGRLAEAQVKWEASHGVALPMAGAS